MAKQCVLETKPCTGCGECDRCDLDPNKICDNCCRCIEDTDFRAIKIDEIIMDAEAGQDIAKPIVYRVRRPNTAPGKPLTPPTAEHRHKRK